jgi:CelD/BcsL family acetyltransferase involved in cellulose biosynthesis
MLQLQLTLLGQSDLVDLRPAWQQMVVEDSGASLFATPLWIENYCRHRTRAGGIWKVVAASSSDARLIGLLLLARETVSWRQLPAIRSGHSTGEYVSDWSCAQGYAERFVPAAYDYLAQNDASWFRLTLVGVPEFSPVLHAWRVLCKERGLAFSESAGVTVPYVNVDRPVDEANRLAKPKYRRELTRRARELGQLGEVHFSQEGSAINAQAALEEFTAVEASGWKGRDGGAIACQADAQSFWQSLVREAAATGCLRLDMLRLAGKVIAGQLGIVWRDRYYCLRVAYDENYRRYGPGALLTAHVLQQCVEDPRVRVYDFAGAARPYMWNWTSSSYQTWNLSIARPEFLPALAFRGLSRGRRAARTLRRWLGNDRLESTDESSRQAAQD